MDTTITCRASRCTALGAAGLLAGALLLTGCAAEVRTAQDAPSASPSSTAAGASPSVRVDRNEAAVLAWESATGNDCLQEESAFQKELDNAHKVVSCADGALIASFWSADAQQAGQDAIGKELGPDYPDHVFLAGDKWGAFVADDIVEAMQAELGGELKEPEFYERIEVSKIGDLVEAWEVATGKECGESAEDLQGKGTVGVDCADFEASVWVYESQAEIDQKVEDIRSLLESFEDDQEDDGEETNWLIGDRWLVSADQEVMEEMQYIIGGELVRLD